MYSTKRKFHTLLDSLTASTNERTSSTTKRARASVISLPSEVGATDIKRGSLETAVLQRARLTRARAGPVRDAEGASPARPATARPRPSVVNSSTTAAHRTEGPSNTSSYAPWDRARFLERLKSFRHVDRWTVKPPKIGEVAWAKRGWTCVGKERVACLGGCGKEVVISLSSAGGGDDGADDGQDDQGDGEIDGALVQRYVSMMVDEHAVDCLWRRRGCEDSIYHLTLSPPSASIASLRARYDSLMNMSHELPTRTTAPEQADVDHILQQMPEEFTRVEAESSPGPIDRQALTLALFGWEAEQGHIKGLISCGACFRRLGLWLFRDRPATATAQVDGTDDDTPSMSQLDVRREHRDYCPWVNATTQSGGDGPRPAAGTMKRAGWEILVGAVQTTHHLRADSKRDVPDGASGHGDEHEIDHDGASRASFVTDDDERSLRDARDGERWAKIKKLKQAFNLKVRRKKSQASVKTNGAANI